jgi:hypothetical protein
MFCSRFTMFVAGPLRISQKGAVSLCPALSLASSSITPSTPAGLWISAGSPQGRCARPCSPLVRVPCSASISWKSIRLPISTRPRFISWSGSPFTASPDSPSAVAASLGESLGKLEKVGEGDNDFEGRVPRSDTRLLGLIFTNAPSLNNPGLLVDFALFQSGDKGLA